VAKEATADLEHDFSVGGEPYLSRDGTHERRRVTPPMRGPRGVRVYLRPLEPEDVALIAFWYADDGLRRIMGNPPRSVEQIRQRVAERVAGHGDKSWSFMICRLEDDRVVGRIDLFELDLTNGSCAFGITIGDRADWDKGYGSDAVNAIVDFAFGELRMERVWLDTAAYNTRAHAAYHKAGFVEEGRLRHAWIEDGRHIDGIRMSILREEWLVLPRKRSWELIEPIS
jgi:RimJ/RimL family protein N-acetyltransferase